jgi:hypothetical protein
MEAKPKPDSTSKKPKQDGAKAVKKRLRNADMLK